MPRRSVYTFILLCLTLLYPVKSQPAPRVASGVAAEEKADLLIFEPRDSRSNVFSAKVATFSYTVKSTTAWRGKVEWTLAAENGRVLDRGESNVAVAPDKPGEVTIKVPIPQVRPGVILTTHVHVRLLAAGAAEPVKVHERPLQIFPADPFVDRKEWLKNLKIHLFDPEKSTANFLKQLNIPFEPVAEVGELANIKEGILLVGTGVSFKDNTELSTILNQLAARGLPVLCVAPKDGLVTIPGKDVKGPQPRAIHWQRIDYISTLDKRLDNRDWLPDGKILDRTLTRKSEDGVDIAEVVPGDKGWPWLQIEYPVRRGRLIICCYSLFGPAWDASPTPRYLLLHLLENLAGKAEDRIPDEK